MAEVIFGAAPEPKTELGRYRILSSTAGIRVSPLQLGAMSVGDAWAGFMGSMSKEQSFALLDHFAEAGGNFIDTANNYQAEQSEAWIGEWMAARGNRDQMVVATKYTTDYKSYALGKGRAPNHCGNSRRSMRVSLRDSLRKLRTDWVDILYLHWWDFTTSVREIMDALHVLVQQGQVLYLGASDTPAWLVAAANEYALAHGKTPFSIYQGRWNVMRRDFERDIIPLARHYGMALAPWDVLGGGKFQTRRAIEERRQRGEGLRNIFSADQSDDERRVSEALEAVARELGVESITAVALAYVRAKAHNVFPLVGGRKIEHLDDNIRALSIKLTPAQVEFLEGVTSFDIGFPNDFIGPDPHVTGKFTGLAAANAPLQVELEPKPVGLA
ncbi:Putative aryl-alcohol dehydrogenase aad14 [Purpureocillium takamizusanense]|uniref:Aldo-keto reductase ausK n=1 Tax=Purpureocillium takamizusanense TaxID=2060973 RepID=A0A9Q8QL81_9HYPO|nr:Putative aryl-alcohol dehydrogenase aad14 [Purpureocillium takamizusanense]UNI21760.1 Putative aryl-alcohol dehydrogenase aad14 [Purpureocillium takamizusanense]